MPKFNPKTATIEYKQDYAACVNHFYPTMSGIDIIVVKVIIVITLLSVSYAGYRGWKDCEWIGLGLFTLIASVAVPVSLILLYESLSFLFS